MVAPAAIGVGTITAGAGAMMSAYVLAAKADLNASIAVHSGGHVSSFVKVLNANCNQLSQDVINTLEIIYPDKRISKKYL